MVRIMVQHLMDIGQGRKEGQDIPDVIQARNREKTGKTAPAEGLYLEKIYLSEEELRADLPDDTEIISKKNKERITQ